jgi:hypothetical protein
MMTRAVSKPLRAAALIGARPPHSSLFDGTTTAKKYDPKKEALSIDITWTKFNLFLTS